MLAEHRVLSVLRGGAGLLEAAEGGISIDEGELGGCGPTPSPPATTLPLLARVSDNPAGGDETTR